MSKKLTWKEKIENASESQWATTPKGRMYITTPRELESLVRKVKKGRVATTIELGESLAKTNDADFTCPLTLGIFLGMLANEAEEDAANGKSRITPYWRIVKEGGVLYEKYLGVPSQQPMRLQADGVACVEDKKGFRVASMAKGAKTPKQAAKKR